VLDAQWNLLAYNNILILNVENEPN
jgi:hypothetical protein